MEKKYWLCSSKVYLLDENIAKNVSLEFKKQLNDKNFKEAIDIAGLKNVSNNLKLRQNSLGEKEIKFLEVKLRG